MFLKATVPPDPDSPVKPLQEVTLLPVLECLGVEDLGAAVLSLGNCGCWKDLQNVIENLSPYGSWLGLGLGPFNFLVFFFLISFASLQSQCNTIDVKTLYLNPYCHDAVL